MSDTDSDWFDKDLDEFIVQVPSSRTSNQTSEDDTSVIYFDNDYGGSYSQNTTNCVGNPNEVSVSTYNNKLEHISPMTFKQLNYLLEQIPINVFLYVIQTDSGFFQTLNRSSISVEMILATMKVIKIIIQTPFFENIRVFLKTLFTKTEYWKQVENLLKKQTKVTLKQKSSKTILHRTEIWEHIHTIFYISIHFKLPTYEFIKNVCNIIEKNQNNELNLSQFKEQFELLMYDFHSNEKQRFQTYHQMDIYPSLDELKDEQQSYVKANITKGHFDSVVHYLDIHMALIREDFITPLREGINEIIQQQINSNLPAPKSNLNVRVYPNVQIITKPEETSSLKAERIIVDLKANTRSKQHQSEEFNDREYSKKLMYGSMVCFSSTHHFEDLIIAVVSNSDIHLTNNGYIQIEIIRSYNIKYIFNRNLLMCESEVYFEPYRHVYYVLKNLTNESFPFSNYIINVDPSPRLPGYTYNGQRVDITNIWPSASEMMFNDGQFEAIEHALTRQFAVIQGPPGTGKTSLGLQIIACLLANTDFQILIVSHTNHTLDQFLNGASQYTDSIVRIGNQSKSENIERFNIKQLCTENITDKRIKKSLFNLKIAYSEAIQEFRDLQNSEECDQIFEKYTQIQDKIQSIKRMREEIKQIDKYQIIKSKRIRIIGMTSTGAARYNALINLLETPIVIFEEAAEILESSCIAALTKSIQHLILIGDHQQLRPRTSVYELARKYQMDISLFERMINNNINCVTLKTQYRMRPEIANLIRVSIYEELLDDESVKLYPNVKGMVKNLYFVDHTEPETDVNIKK